MARRTRLGDALLSASHEHPDTPADDDNQTDSPAGTATTDQGDSQADSDSPPQSNPRKTTKKTATKKTAAKKTAAKKTTAKKTAAKETTQQPTAGQPATEQSTEPVVLGIDTQDAKRLSIYLHPDDHRELLLARAENGTDANSVIRAMIALWRANPRFRKQVDRLARTAPRGGQGGR